MNARPSRKQLDKRCLCGSGKAFKNCHGTEYLAPKTTRIARYAEQPVDPYMHPPGYAYMTVAALDAEGNPLSDPRGEPGE
jgi:hypothetical protein